MPGAMPVGGGVDGPQYADFQDATDQQQIAGAAQSARQSINLVEDTLTMDIAKFAGEVKLQQSKAEAPVIAPFIKIRTTGPLEMATRSLAQIKEEFLRLLEKLSPKLRAQLLKDMSLPKEQRDPNLRGLEHTLLREAEANLWARGILVRRQSDEEDDEGQESDERGIFASEDEDPPFKAGDVIPPAHLVPIAILEPHVMSHEEMCKQVDANAWHAVHMQLRTLEAQYKGMAKDDIRRAIVRDAIKVAIDILKDARSFLDLRYAAGYDKARKGAKSFKAASPTFIARQKEVFSQALGGEESEGLRILISATLDVAQLATSLMSSRSPSAALSTTGAAMCHTLLMKQSSWVGQEMVAVWDIGEQVIKGLGLDDATNELLTLVMLVLQAVAWLAVTAEDLVPLQHYKPKSQVGISLVGTTGADEPDLKDKAHITSVQAAAFTLAVAHVLRGIAPELARSLGDWDDTTLQALAYVTQLLSLTVNRITGVALFDKLDVTDSVYAKAIATASCQAAQALVVFGDDLEEANVIAEVTKELKLGQLAYEDSRFQSQMATRQEQLEEYGVKSDDLIKGGQQLVDIIGNLAIEIAVITSGSGKITPNVNVMIG